MRRDLPMNKILIVGHPASGYQDVEALLHACGMGQAQPSRRDGFLPEQISETLCKAHQVPPLSELQAETPVRQIQAGPVWHGMALDLLLGNIEQPLWGWADPKSLHLLEYWRDLDPTVYFILVYDEPRSAIARARINDSAAVTADAVEQDLSTWTAYNAAMLHFFHRNPTRCFLVHSRQVLSSASHYVQEVQARIDAPWAALPEGHEVDGLPRGTAETGTRVDVARTNGPEGESLALFIAGSLVRADAECASVYEELQASAHLPLTHASGAESSGIEAWNAMTKTLNRLDVAYREAREQSRLASESRAAHEDAVSKLEASIKNAETDKAERELLLIQIQRVQEELEHQHELARRLRLRVEEADQVLELTRQERDDARRAASLHQQLAEEARSQLASSRGELQRLQADMSRARDEQARQISAANGERNLLRSQLENDKQLADRRLREAEELRKTLASVERETQARVQQLQSDLAKCTEQLSAATARLNLPLAQENELLLTQLQQVQEELECYYAENVALKGASQNRAPEFEHSTSAPTVARLTGAAARVRAELPYRLGATLIQNSRSARGWIQMPFSIWGAVRTKPPGPGSRSGELPPIESYLDAHEAERVRNHLSYRLGSVFLRNVRSPIGWVRMPFEVRREVVAFRNRSVARGR